MKTIFDNFHPDNGNDYTDQYGYTPKQRKQGLELMVYDLIHFKSIDIADENQQDEDDYQTLWLGDLIDMLEESQKSEVLIALLDMKNDPVEAVELLKELLVGQLEFELSNSQIDYNIYRGNYL